MVFRATLMQSVSIVPLLGLNPYQSAFNNSIDEIQKEDHIELQGQSKLSQGNRRLRKYLSSKLGLGKYLRTNSSLGKCLNKKIESLRDQAGRLKDVGSKLCRRLFLRTSRYYTAPVEVAEFDFLGIGVNPKREPEYVVKYCKRSGKISFDDDNNI